MKSKKLNNLLRLFILWNMTIFYSSLAIANQEEYKYPFQKKIVILKLTGDVIGKENVQCVNCGLKLPSFLQFGLPSL